jgi:8-oxo-dGTP diphosphatase
MNPASTARTPIDVAVGVLIRADGKFLITSRPEGKPYAGYWEFPGGKLEVGETVEHALQRELDEELGIHIHLNRVERWKELVMEYPHAVVRLHFCKVWDWAGELEMREHQQFAWETLPPHIAPLLPGTIPVLQWLNDEKNQVNG